MLKKTKIINEVKVDEYTIEGLCELIPLTDMSYNELKDRFNALDEYAITSSHARHKKIVLYFIRYEINILTQQFKKKKKN